MCVLTGFVRLREKALQMFQKKRRYHCHEGPHSVGFFGSISSTLLVTLISPPLSFFLFFFLIPSPPHFISSLRGSLQIHPKQVIERIFSNRNIKYKVKVLIDCSYQQMCCPSLQDVSEPWEMEEDAGRHFYLRILLAAM